jgi:uncharacterized protein YkwD
MPRRLPTRPLALALVSCAVAVALAALAAAPAAASAAQRPSACSAARVDVRAETIAIARAATLCLLNRERSSRGLRPLRVDARLTTVARGHSRDMVRRRYFEHDAPNGRTPFDRMLATHYVPRHASWTLGENLGWGSETLAQPAALVRAWMHSPSHRANILNGSFREIGIGIALGVPVRGGVVAREPGATYTTDFGAHS